MIVKKVEFRLSIDDVAISLKVLIELKMEILKHNMPFGGLIACSLVRLAEEV